MNDALPLLRPLGQGIQKGSFGSVCGVNVNVALIEKKHGRDTDGDVHHFQTGIDRNFIGLLLSLRRSDQRSFMVTC